MDSPSSPCIGWHAMAIVCARSGVPHD
jgi:hypothetical protein